MSPSLVALRLPPRPALGHGSAGRPARIIAVCLRAATITSPKQRTGVFSGRVAPSWSRTPVCPGSPSQLAVLGIDIGPMLHRRRALVGVALGLRGAGHGCAALVSVVFRLDDASGPGGTIAAGSHEATGARQSRPGALRRARRGIRDPSACRSAFSRVCSVGGRRRRGRAGGGRFGAPWRSSRRQDPARLRARTASAGSLDSPGSLPTGSYPIIGKNASEPRADGPTTGSSSPATTPECARSARRRSASPPGRRIAQSSLPSAPVRNSREPPARAAHPRETAADGTAGSADQTSPAGGNLGNFRLDSDFPTNFRAARRISTSLAMRHDAPLSCTGAPHVNRCTASPFRHHADSTPVLGRNSVALSRFQHVFGPKMTQDCILRRIGRVGGRIVPS
jgi:hypothetical protein